MGVMGNNPDQAGRYNGLNTTGIDLVGEFRPIGAARWDSDGDPVLQLHRRQSGLPDRQRPRQRRRPATATNTSNTYQQSW